MSLLDDLNRVDALGKSQGVSVAGILAWAASAGFGIDARLLTTPPPGATLDPSQTDILERLIFDMTKLQDAIAALNAEVAESRSQLASVVAYVQGVPTIVATAVAEALANVGVDDAASAAAVDAARSSIDQSVNEVLAAIPANTANPAPLPVEPPPAEPATDATMQPETPSAAPDTSTPAAEQDAADAQS